jgi:putative mRNA 3-end processing factor
VYVDGMGIRAAHRMLIHPGSFLNPGHLERALDNATAVRNQSDRKDALDSPCVILTTAGMLQGGPVSFYIDKLSKRKDCAMVLTGYQVDGTAGRNLLDTGIYDNGEIRVKPEFPIHFLDFSAHTDRGHLIEFYKNVNPGKVVLVHGDGTKKFAEELRGMGFDATAPVNGDVMKA